jgi:elongation factor P--beta-lysine ligase
MKRLLGVGMERIYQITRSFRNGELGPLHNPEFAILEWYRAYASYEEVMVDIEQLVAYVAEKTTGKPSIIRQGQVVDLTPPWPRISVHEAFVRWAGIDLQICPEVGNLFSRAVALGYASVTPQDSWEDIFQKIFLAQIEPNLASLGTVHLLDYPRQLAALAKEKKGNPAVVERTEAFVGGVELTNGYTELNDPTEQKERFTTGREQSAVDDAPIDQAFLDAMECGFPPAGGVALGVDRLVMLIAGADRVDEVIAFPMGF